MLVVVMSVYVSGSLCRHFHSQANCTSTGPGAVNCTCPDNYLGDGTRCFTTIAGHIMAHDNLTLLAQLIKVGRKKEVSVMRV